MNTDKTTETPQAAPAVGAQVDRGVRALDPERAAFEAWAFKRWGAEAYRHTSATSGEWEAWQAARPKRVAVGAIVKVAAALAQRKPLEAFVAFDDATHIGHRQFGRAYSRADEDTRLLAVKLADAVRAL